MTQHELNRIRHSCSHIMAYAVKELYPAVKLGIGPAIEEGFYYDFDTEESLSEEIFPRIEAKMRDIIKRKYAFEHENLSKQAALDLFTAIGETYKCELIRELPNDTVSIYKTGTFIDLCKGPHVNNTGDIKAFKLLSNAGAYWRGNERNKMLTRIYGTAFYTKKELDEYIHKTEEAKKRDHRIVGRKLGLFSFHQEAPGFPFYHPKGMRLYNELIEYWREEHSKEDYVEVRTPIILRDELWRRSGHYEHYKEHMYFTEIDGGSFAVKPMNCPGELLIYKSQQHSYRELPIRMAELGLVHRHELSGVMHGLFRVKAFTIDDAHIFCLEEQIAAEVARAVQLVLRIYQTFGFSNVAMELSTRPKESMGSDEMWEKATAGLQQALDNHKMIYKINEGEGAFYGPKIDFHIRDSLDRSWQCGTVQLDFSMPERFDLEYIGPDGQAHRPVLIHRAAFGSIERFLGILIEHYNGAFPLWLAPLQVRVLTISERFQKYAEEIYEALRAAVIKCDSDLRGEKIGYKIREAENLKINYMVIVGEKEVADHTISLRQRGRKDLGSTTIEAFIQQFKKEIALKQ